MDLSSSNLERRETAIFVIACLLMAAVFVVTFSVLSFEKDGANGITTSGISTRPQVGTASTFNSQNGSSQASAVERGVSSFRSYSDLESFMAANAKSAEQYS